jgi:hypothetical protein
MSCCLHLHAETNAYTEECTEKWAQLKRFFYLWLLEEEVGIDTFGPPIEDL